jgi:molecular chaperone HscB
MKKDGVGVVNHSIFKSSGNPFEILGIDPTFEVDAKTLDEAYFARQTLAHPDRFVHHSEPEQEAATVQSSFLNQAYETLKNPTLRAKALLKLKGIEVCGEEEGKTVQNPEILEEMMNLQEALAQAVSPYDFNCLEKKIQDCLHDVKASFSTAICQNKDQELTGLFLRLTYLSKLMEDIKVCRRRSSIKVL